MEYSWPHLVLNMTTMFIFLFITTTCVRFKLLTKRLEFYDSALTTRESTFSLLSFISCAPALSFGYN